MRAAMSSRRHRSDWRRSRFYARVLGAGGGRARFLARLGHEANDALDEFLDLALGLRARTRPLAAGLRRLAARGASEVKRDMEIARDEVRVMTVHGAKGLEAHMVILADTATKPTGPKDPRLFPCRAHRWSGRGAIRRLGAMAEARAVAQRRRATNTAACFTSR